MSELGVLLLTKKKNGASRISFSSHRMVENEVPNALPRFCGTLPPSPTQGFFFCQTRLLVIHMATKASKRLIKRQLINYHSTSFRPFWLISDGAEPKCQIMWVIHHPRRSSVPSIPPVSSSLMNASFWPNERIAYSPLVAGPLTTTGPTHLSLTFPPPLPPLPPYPSHGLLYCYCIITLPKCNLLKHAITRLLKSGAKKKIKIKTKSELTFFSPYFFDVHPDCTPCPVF